MLRFSQLIRLASYTTLHYLLAACVLSAIVCLPLSVMRAPSAAAAASNPAINALAGDDLVNTLGNNNNPFQSEADFRMAAPRATNGDVKAIDETFNASDAVGIEDVIDLSRDHVPSSLPTRSHERNHVNANVDGFSLFGLGYSNSYFAQFLSSRRRRSMTPISRNRCALKLVADYEFFHLIGIDNYANAARYLVNMIERINGIFTQVDWGIEINGYRLVNLGFSIKEIKIYDRPTSTSPLHFNSNVSTRSDGSFSSHDILESFSREEGTNSTCLTVLISGKVFDYGILGLANIGRPLEGRGLCAIRPFNNTYMNTAVMTVRRKTELMITRVVDLVVAHELGHSWGSLHDPPDDPECVPPNSQSGRFVMHESSNTGYDKNNYNFSQCSIRAIQKVLYELAYDCFEEEKTSLCGNGILEEDEECDAGWHRASSSTLFQSMAINGDTGGDLCCTSKCRLRKGAKCSPLHAECCTARCDFAPSSTICQQRSNEICRLAAFCTGKSDKCPEPASVEDGIDCVDEGKCLSGECIPFCQRYSNDSTPCICEDVAESCLRCCRSLQTGICMPVKPEKYLAEGSICIQGQCHNNVCEKKLTDKTQTLWKHWLKNIQETPSPKLFADNFVFVIVFVSLLVWCPCGAFIVYKDHQRHMEMMQASKSHEDEEEIYSISANKQILHAKQFSR